MMEKYLNQDVQLEAKNGVNDYNEPQYDDAINIKARLQKVINEVVRRDGEKVRGEAVLYTQTKVAIDDRITYEDREYIAITQEQMYGFNHLEGYKIILL